MNYKFGKKSGDILNLKSNFFSDNDKFLKESLKINKIYKKQPIRKFCKNCKSKLISKFSFIKYDIKYKLCLRCEHLNGIYEDTNEFCDYVYSKDDGKKYSKNYFSKNKKNFNDRVKNIYLPKAKFLLENLQKNKSNIKNLKFVDLGAGSGYLVKALSQLKIKNIVGYDVSKTQVELGNIMIGKKLLKSHELSEVYNLAAKLDADVVSMIGVLEHLQQPEKMLHVLKNNKRIKYLYISVPTFSPTVFFEMLFPDIMQRQLSAGHTHLYTEKSINWFIKKYSLKKIAMWWFGTDMVDLHRNTYVSLLKNKKLKNISAVWEKKFVKCIDDLQLVIDKNFLSSEVHMLLKFK
tara:strand:- start:1082 stop:2125 length:1044 start_codon:yes stop_codon:yes gene_type:complete